jgi:hypothetical protein
MPRITEESDMLAQLRRANPRHADYVDTLIGRIKDREFGMSHPGEVEVMRVRNIVSKDEYDILCEVYPGEPTAREMAFIEQVWGKR